MKQSDETELAEKKRIVRQAMRKAIFEFTAEKNRAGAASKKIEGLLLGSELYAASDAVFIFVSDPSEVETRGIIASALKNKKRVALPRCIDAYGTMEFYYLDAALPFELQTEIGAYGLTEPKTLLEKVDTKSFPHASLFLVPALAFSRDGRRLGKGKGFYDRYIARISYAFPVLTGLCFSCQIINDVPSGVRDAGVSHIVCEDGIFPCSPPHDAD
ncbi:5-formyltetrahydrofolate cyclo-ligase [Treponema socranskii]|uniref:5-formyltetrahydrofolate cyclo-ligase n=1 Tax=Treponema socranskii TaxID=53419 RepID=UPI003D932890